MVSILDRVPITSLMSVNIKWQDSTYCTVLESVELFLYWVKKVKRQFSIETSKELNFRTKIL